MKQFSKIAAILTAFFLSLAVCGCQIQSKQSDESEPIDISKVNINPDTGASFTLRVAVADSAVEQKSMKNISAIFNKTYPNINVSVETMGSSVSSYIQNSYATNNLPDIFMLSQFDMIKLDAMEILYDFQPYISAETVKGTFDSSDYVEAYWKLGQRNFNGDQLMISRTMDRVVCHYNPKIFKAAGVDMSLVKNGWTWDDFKTVSAKLRTYYDNQGITSPLADSNYNWEAMINPIFESYGVQYFDDNGKVTIDSTATKNALDFIKDLVDKKYFSGPNGGGADFDNLKGCMAFDSQPLTYHMGRMKENLSADQNIKDYYNVVTMPVMPGHENIGAGAAGYAMSYNTKHSDYAWKFLKLIAEKEGQNALADGGITQPSIRKDMSGVSLENHWTVGFEDYNLEAYTFKNGSS